MFFSHTVAGVGFRTETVPVGRAQVWIERGACAG